MTWKWPFKQASNEHEWHCLYAIVTVRGGKEEVWKTHIRSDKVVRLARSVWKNNQPLDEIWCVNMYTGARTHTICRDPCPECDGRGPGYCPVCKRKKT